VIDFFSDLNPPYRTIVADPPWPTNNPGARGQVGMADGKPESHYSILSVGDICALPVLDLAAPNAHLYLWCTASGLGDGLRVMESWGFTYKTALTWCKQGHLGLGAYFRTQTEHILFGVRGSLRTLDPARGQRTFFLAPKGGHSVKPGAASDLIEACSPGPYVELFARQPRLGWDAWGYGHEGVV
jgi:N6-adenosine-specific RNA methylase IME4